MSTTHDDDRKAPQTVNLDITINQDQFLDTVPVYATIPSVSFDGFNYHLVFFTSAPAPVTDEEHEAEENAKVRVAARLVLPPITVEATINALIRAVTQPQPRGLLVSHREEDEKE